ncbi:MAG: TVP38/TMEM64 family protein [Reyranellaceae bacterium]
MLNSLKRVAVGTAGRLPLMLVVLAMAVFLASGGSRYITIATISDNARWLRHTAESWGAAAPLLFIAVNAGLLMLLVVPAWFCTTIAGLLFGLWLGAACAIVGTTLGASAVFLAARAGLGGLADGAGPRAAAVVAGFRGNGLSYLVFLRLVPLFPFTLVNVAAALARIPLQTFVFATLIGTIPSILIYASFGEMLMDLAKQGGLPNTSLLQQPRFLFPLLGLAALALVPILVARWRRRR